MKRFRYALDPLCVGACVTYAVCRWVIRPHWTGHFWHGYSTDCLFIPAALPLLLWMQRKLGLRRHDGYPDWREIGVNFAVWSIAAEGVAPFLFKTAVGDWMDVVAYASGALVAGIWWTFTSRTGFDRLAPHYNWMEKVLAGPRLQRCRTAWFDQLAASRRILIVGVGHGPELPALTARCPDAHFTCVDASAGMLAAAEARVLRDGLDPARLTFIHVALPAWQPPAGEYDAIVTNFFLDCFSGEELRTVVHTLATGATPEARWVISDFTVPPRGLARLRARLVHALMYVFFRVVTGLRAARVTAPDPLLAAQGFTLTNRQTSEWGLLHADLWSRTGS